MNKNIALFFAGSIFAIVSLVHLVRLFFHFEIIIADYPIPMWFSVIGFFIAFILSVWMFKASR